MAGRWAGRRRFRPLALCASSEAISYLNHDEKEPPEHPLRRL
jgi:hypothetical protein